MTMLNRIKQQLNEQPLFTLLVIAFIPRLLAVIFSKGYGMHDDHFLVIEAAQSWVDGDDYNDWLPSSGVNETPTGHSWFYVGLHYFFFSFLELLGIVGSQAKMYIVRFLHALYSLLIIPPVFFIVKRTLNKDVAIKAGLLIGLLWFMPIMSVRNLVEMVCIPPVLWATWVLFKDKTLPVKDVILAGMLCGLAMAFRFHVILFIAGFALFFVLQKKWFSVVLFGIAAVAVLFVTQIGDLFIWERPFAELTEYIRYNLANKTSYFNRPWYQYFGTLGGLIIAPISLFLFVGYAKGFKKYLLLFLPAFIFFAFHSYFPNKQERFILPVVPFLVTLGMIGWYEILENNKDKMWLQKINIWGWRFFIFINGILLLVVTPAYSKKSRVEAMEIMSAAGDYNGCIQDYMVEGHEIIMPQFYAANWKPIYYLNKGSDTALIYDWITNSPIDQRPNYIYFIEKRELDERILDFESKYNASLSNVGTAKPSYIDLTLHWLNPNNSNETAYIYKIEYHQ